MQVPSQVWIGQSAKTKEAVITFLQQQFCKEMGCSNCLICKQINTEQYHNILWLSPQGQYKVEQMREVLSRLSLMLSANEKFYFIFQGAQHLNAACANSLLKSIEEPPSGYNFIFLTSRKELVLPTILSRSTIKTFSIEQGQVNSELYSVFTLQNKANPIEFFQILDRQKDLNHQESYELLDAIYSFWLEKSKQGGKDCADKVKYLQSMLALPPMPGSSKLFWKEIYFNL